MIRKLVQTALLLLPVASYAGGWQSSTTVVRIVHEGEDDGSRVYVLFASNWNPDSCPNGNTAYFRIYGTSQKGKNIIATLIMALAASRVVVPHISGCDDWGRAVVTGLFVE